MFDILFSYYLPPLVDQIIYFLQTAATTTPPPAPAATPPPPPAATIIQTVPTTAVSSSVDLGTLATTVTPIIAAIAGIWIKIQKDMKKKDEESVQKTASLIDTMIVPALQQNAAVFNQTAKQEVKINQMANLVYKVMGEKANEIEGLPEIQQVNLIKDEVTAQIMAQQYQQQVNQAAQITNQVATTTPTAANKIANKPAAPPPVAAATAAPSIVWDEVTKSWVSK